MFWKSLLNLQNLKFEKFQFFSFKLVAIFFERNSCIFILKSSIWKLDSNKDSSRRSILWNSKIKAQKIKAVSKCLTPIAQSKVTVLAETSDANCVSLLYWYSAFFECKKRFGKINLQNAILSGDSWKVQAQLTKRNR